MSIADINFIITPSIKGTTVCDLGSDDQNAC